MTQEQLPSLGFLGGAAWVSCEESCFWLSFYRFLFFCVLSPFSRRGNFQRCTCERLTNGEYWFLFFLKFRTPIIGLSFFPDLFPLRGAERPRQYATLAQLWSTTWIFHRSALIVSYRFTCIMACDLAQSNPSGTRNRWVPRPDTQANKRQCTTNLLGRKQRRPAHCVCHAVWFQSNDCLQEVWHSAFFLCFNHPATFCLQDVLLD